MDRVVACRIADALEQCWGIPVRAVLVRRRRKGGQPLDGVLSRDRIDRRRKCKMSRVWTPETESDTNRQRQEGLQFHKASVEGSRFLIRQGQNNPHAIGLAKPFGLL